MKYERWDAEGWRIQDKQNRVYTELIEAMNRGDHKEQNRLLGEWFRLNDKLKEHMNKMPPK